jgi:hypothetical protein
MAAVIAEEGIRLIEVSARTALGGDIEPIADLLKREPVNTIALRREIARRLLEAGRYVA